MLLCLLEDHLLYSRSVLDAHQYQMNCRLMHPRQTAAGPHHDLFEGYTEMMADENWQRLTEAASTLAQLMRALTRPPLSTRPQLTDYVSLFRDRVLIVQDDLSEATQLARNILDTTRGKTALEESRTSIEMAKTSIEESKRVKICKYDAHSEKTSS